MSGTFLDCCPLYILMQGPKLGLPILESLVGQLDPEMLCLFPLCNGIQSGHCAHPPHPPRSDVECGDPGS